MKRFRLFLAVGFLLVFATGAYAQRMGDQTYLPKFAIKTNALYWATSTPNLGIELGLAKKLTLDISGNYNPWKFSDNKQFKHWLVQPELRYWLHERFNGHFLGVHALYADYDVAGKTLLNVMKSDYAYEGNAYGGGISYGYQLYLSPHWNIEFTAGVGYVRFKYDKTPFPAGQEAAGSYRNDYFGPTKLGISIMYIIK